MQTKKIERNLRNNIQESYTNHKKSFFLIKSKKGTILSI